MAGDVVIGIGNEMRGDDGVGPRVVNALLPRADLETMTVRQLLPEFAEKIRSARRVLFVDARIGGTETQWDHIKPDRHRGVGHSCSPEALLGWTEQAFSDTPDSWLLSIPGTVFDLGADLSPGTKALIPDALRRIESWLDDCPGSAQMRSEEVA